MDRIAAGEVIEAPYSVIKELVENALDAGASSIEVETAGAGMDLVRVRDNGLGIHPEDLAAAVERHATSKIADLNDLEAIYSFGFRGEALASIASVSRLEIRSRRAGAHNGVRLVCRGGEQLHIDSDAWPRGTQVQAEELFFATPARRKFVRSERSENLRNLQALQRLALARPDVEFRYLREGRERFRLPAHQELRQRIQSVCQLEQASLLLPVEGERQGIRLTGYTTAPQVRRGMRDWQFQFVNGRAVDIRSLSFIVRKAYGELLPAGMHPGFCLFFEIDAHRVDVNVHPAKREVRMLDEQHFYPLVTDALQRALQTDAPMLAATERFQVPNRVQHSLAQINLETGELLASPPPAPQEYPILRAVADDAALATQSPIRSKPGKRSAFLPRRHFGVIAGVYILAEDDEGLCIIDQHTAHERINYELFRRRLEQRADQRQPLLTPIAIHCQPEELESIVDRMTDLQASGFAIEALGPQAYAIRECPDYIEPGEERDVLSMLISRILDGESGVRLYDEYAAMKACKASIKRNDIVSGEVISQILQQLSECEDPSRCPHGRPTILRISRNDLDAMFQRS
ncbi:MAG: DNA mismatch repair endonuclease MutL [Leptospirales bacterium]|nr:DNA mismatch repair endonuclease MutL [Leptospirales bacterium]